MSETDARPQAGPQTPEPDGLTLLRDPRGGWRLGAGLRMADRPGELAGLAAFLAGQEANIERFSYNRSENPYVVRMEVRCANASRAGLLADELARQGRLEPPDRASLRPEPITDPGGLLSIKATLEDRPGTLARLAEVFRQHGASVIHMAYDGDAAPGLAEITMATDSPQQVAALLEDLTTGGWHFHVQWQGADSAAMEAVIGLSAAEQFLFRLRRILPPDRLDRLKALFESSDEMGRALMDFRRQAGADEESMAASGVFANILHLAAASLGRTGERFSMRLAGPIVVTSQVSLYTLACPTGANGFLLRAPEEDILVDSGYGLYWPDARDWLARHGFDPARIRRAFFTHPDADHAGWAASLERDCGTLVHLHPDCAGVFSHGNRAQGTGTRLQALNLSFTRLITRLTELDAPQHIAPFSRSPQDPAETGGFPVLGCFAVGDVDFLVLESLGGHVAGQVFYYAPQGGLLFCGDYLIDVPSLSERDKSILSVPKYLMTSTNADSRVFSREMAMLRGLMRETQARLIPQGKVARVCSGHGWPYTVDEAGWEAEG
jgi:glyoxylase-like metal-dependent hydrolase (beta-lactamase superfamily II)/glycine cleavage system regulatory protein